MCAVRGGGERLSSDCPLRLVGEWGARLAETPRVLAGLTSAADAISSHAYKVADKAEFEKLVAKAIVDIEATDMNSAQSPQIADERQALSVGSTALPTC